VGIEMKTVGDNSQTLSLKPPGWLVWLVGLVMLTALLVWAGLQVITWEKLCQDYMCFWAAGKILASGENPYDFDLQARIQHEYGWDKETDGLGFFDFLPYRFPPSVMGPLSVLLIPFGFPTARMIWFVLNVEALFLSGYLLRNSVKGVSWLIPIFAIPFFALSVLAALVGQVSPLVLLLLAVAWRLLEGRWDHLAGWVLAWMNMKPQLTAVVVLAILGWSVRNRRWSVITGFAAGLSILVGISTWLVPTWPIDLVRSSSTLPLITESYPAAGTTWLLLLRSLGFEGWTLKGLYLALALPLGFLVMRAALARDSELGEVFGWGLLAAFFVASYARPYDFPVLVIPLLLLLGGRIREIWGTLILFLFLVIPYLQLLFWLPASFFWIPLLLAAALVSSIVRSRVSDRSVPAPRTDSAAEEMAASINRTDVSQ
jgi:hypothetical protein